MTFSFSNYSMYFGHVKILHVLAFITWIFIYDILVTPFCIFLVRQVCQYMIQLIIFIFNDDARIKILNRYAFPSNAPQPKCIYLLISYSILGLQAIIDKLYIYCNNFFEIIMQVLLITSWLQREELNSYLCKGYVHINVYKVPKEN